jgi:hypothetical protein
MRHILVLVSEMDDATPGTMCALVLLQWSQQVMHVSNPQSKRGQTLAKYA